MLDVGSIFQQNVNTKLRNRTQPALSKMFANAENFCHKKANSPLEQYSGNVLLSELIAGTTPSVTHNPSEQPYRPERAEQLGIITAWHRFGTWLNLCAEGYYDIVKCSNRL